jgi:hypothetical protein
MRYVLRSYNILDICNARKFLQLHTMAHLIKIWALLSVCDSSLKDNLMWAPSHAVD